LDEITANVVYVPELQLLVQGPIPGEQTLQGLLESALRADTPEALADLDDYIHKLRLAWLRSIALAWTSARCIAGKMNWLGCAPSSGDWP
jgi:hypothetical protein